MCPGLGEEFSWVQIHQPHININIMCNIYQKYSRVCYNEQFDKERMPQRTIFINKIRILQRTHMLQRMRRNTIGRRSTRVRLTCRAFPLWLKSQSSISLRFVRFSYQFNSVTCLFEHFNSYNLRTYKRFMWKIGNCINGISNSCNLSTVCNLARYWL
jgi:hypothetical protein